MPRRPRQKKESKKETTSEAGSAKQKPDKVSETWVVDPSMFHGDHEEKVLQDAECEKEIVYLPISKLPLNPKQLKALISDPKIVEKLVDVEDLRSSAPLPKHILVKNKLNKTL